MSARSLACSVLFAFVLVTPGSAKATPIVFDFEDGLQGWTLEGSAQRVSTQALGGQWAIFGDGNVEGGASMSLQADLTNVASIELDRFHLGGFFTVAAITLHVEKDGNPIVTADFDATVNPTRLVFDTGNIHGVHQVTLNWASGVPCDAPPGLACPAVIPPNAFLALLDNITLVPIPEPSTLLLVGLGLTAVALRRQR
jgi:hypothetical protein